jgi:hypothetical protein
MKRLNGWERDKIEKVDVFNKNQKIKAKNFKYSGFIANFAFFKINSKHELIRNQTEIGLFPQCGKD